MRRSLQSTVGGRLVAPCKTQLLHGSRMKIRSWLDTLKYMRTWCCRSGASLRRRTVRVGEARVRSARWNSAAGGWFEARTLRSTVTRVASAHRSPVPTSTTGEINISKNTKQQDTVQYRQTATPRRRQLSRSQQDDVTTHEQRWGQVDQMSISECPLQADAGRKRAMQTDIVAGVPVVSFERIWKHDTGSLFILCEAQWMLTLYRPNVWSFEWVAEVCRELRLNASLRPISRTTRLHRRMSKTRRTRAHTKHHCATKQWLILTMTQRDSDKKTSSITCETEKRVQVFQRQIEGRNISISQSSTCWKRTGQFSGIARMSQD